MEKEKLNIFYSWQSDLDHELNRYPIRDSLRFARTKIELETPELKVIIDEATRDVPGSPDIPTTIFEKIDDADIFVCDITTINSKCSSEFRKVPNPNVLIELGYAICHLGLNRVVMIFNTNFGELKTDPPFDIAKKRIASYCLSDKKDKDAKSKLNSLLTHAVKLIKEKNPKRPYELKKLSLEERHQKNDLENLVWLFSNIHTPTIDEFLDEFPNYVSSQILHFWEGFKGVITSSLFYIYDEKLDTMLNKLYEEWAKSLSFSKHYDTLPSGKRYKFKVPYQEPERTEAKNDLLLLEELKFKLIKLFDELFKYVRKNYIELNFRETNKKSIEEYLKFQNE